MNQKLPDKGGRRSGAIDGHSHMPYISLNRDAEKTAEMVSKDVVSKDNN